MPSSKQTNLVPMHKDGAVLIPASPQLPKHASTCQELSASHPLFFSEAQHYPTPMTGCCGRVIMWGVEKVWSAGPFTADNRRKHLWSPCPGDTSGSPSPSQPPQIRTWACWQHSAHLSIPSGRPKWWREGRKTNSARGTGQQLSVREEHRALLLVTGLPLLFAESLNEPWAQPPSSICINSQTRMDSNDPLSLLIWMPGPSKNRDSLTRVQRRGDEIGNLGG